MPTILQVTVPVALYAHFDYLLPSDISAERIQIGTRVKIPFGARKLVGIIIGVADSTDVEPDKLKSIISLLDTSPLIPAETLQLIQWASRYYHYPLGMTFDVALPSLLMQGKNTKTEATTVWRLAEPELLPQQKLTKPQQKLVQVLQQYPKGIAKSALEEQFKSVSVTLRALEKKGLIVQEEAEQYGADPQHLVLNEAQKQAVDQVTAHLNQFYPCLLDGVTGSGKTEVYLQIIQQVIQQNKQILVLIPEINLTPQTVARFRQRYQVPIAVIHSKLSAAERLQTWLQTRDGKVSIIIGTRSAIWTPFSQLGMIIVDEEHDHSYKQQDLLRYSARDMAVVRAHKLGIPVILGSATPCLESLYNAKQGRYQHIVLPERAGTAVHPRFKVINMQHQQGRYPISKALQSQIQTCLDQQQQVLLFINRRGYAPILQCPSCEWTAQCDHCEINMTYHETTRTLHCHHCGTQRPVDLMCPQCQHPELQRLGQGTERIEEILQQQFPDARILRIDSDSTRSKHAMSDLIKQINSGEADILVGTQILAKGHHFHNVTLVGVINIDGGLFGSDYRSAERMAQLFTQVSGRAGRVEQQGTVVVQTFYPDHPLLQHLIREGYQGFAHEHLTEREVTSFPPFTHLAVLRAEAKTKEEAIHFLDMARLEAQYLIQHEAIQLHYPIESPIQKRAGKYRAQLLVQSTQRAALHELLSQWLPKLPNAGQKIRWHLDVDPIELL
ncbi:primosomal protein N' [Candidatus Albibeggiatoa sp. nov. NOAA]|uniref:primosomal protein N' n=1 Tax=Candidatus Albibeggiatoa sp. nov. NOAA TaxID=3162724 RepID=UPI0033053D60|nr:primosomal protein N' [Thiotrichaceae bacterium]